MTYLLPFNEISHKHSQISTPKCLQKLMLSSLLQKKGRGIKEKENNLFILVVEREEKGKIRKNTHAFELERNEKKM